MAYRLTPYDRRVQAELIRQEREARYASRYPTYKKTGAATVAPVQNEKKNDNAFLRVLQTGIDLNANAVGGVWQSVEGLVDLVATGVGAIGGIFSDDFQDGVKDFIATDYTDKLFMQNMDKLTEGSYLNDGKAGEIIEGVAQGVGQMLPDVLISAATMGAYSGVAGAKAAATAGTVAAKQAAKAAAKTAAKQAAIKAGQRAAMVSLAAHATGSGIQEAYQDGASYGEGVAYGALTGATEVATEKLTGGMGRLYGKGIGAAVKTGAKSVGKEVAEVGAKRVLKEMAGEGMEEVISEATNPLRKTIYKGKDALREYGEGDFWAGVAEAGTVGALTSAAYGGTVGKINKTSGVYADANSVAEHIEEQRKKIDTGELTPEQEVQAQKNIKDDMELLSKRLQKVSQKARDKILRSPDMALNFDADGKIKTEIAEKLDANIKAAGDTSSGLDRRYYSASARGREAQIIEGLAAQGTKVFEGELTKEESAAYKKAKEIHRKLKSAGFVDTDLVLSETMPDANAYLDGRTVVIGKDTLADGSYVKHLVHETTHFTEGTQEWIDVMDLVFGKDGSSVKHLIERVKTSGYGVTDADVTVVLDAVREGKLKDAALTEKQQTLVTEVVAMQMEETFGSEDAINRLVGEKPNLAKRILERIKAFLQTFGKSTDQDPEAVKQLRRTEELFRKALEKAGVGYAAEELTRMNEKNVQVSEENGGEGVDEKRKVQYNYKELYTFTNEYVREVHSKDRETFNRWLANKTSNMADGEIRSVAIYCAQRAYFFEADGYMHGHMLRTVSSKHPNIIKRMIEEQENDIHNDAKIAALWSDAVSDQQRGKTDGNDVFADRGRTITNDRIFDQATASDGARNSQRSSADYQIDWEEVDQLIKKLREMIARLDAESNNKVKRSRKQTGETVTLSKGQIAALRANYEGDKVFTKKEVTAAIKSIDALQKLPASMRSELATKLWRGYNERLNEQGFAMFTEIMWHQIHAEILQESGFEISEDEIAHMDEQIVNALNTIVQSGKPSIRARLESDTSTEGYRKQADFWRGEHSKAVQRNKQLNSLKFELEKLANQKKGLYVNAANFRGDSFKVAIDELAKMNWRGGLVNDTKIREHFAKLAAWYTKDNPLYKGDGGTNSLFRQEIADALNSLGNSQNGALTVEDLQAAETVAKYFAHEIEAHNTVFKDGKRVDAMPEAKDYIEKARRAKEIAAKCSIWSNLMRSKFARMVADPAMLMRQADGYLSGFFTEQYEALRQGTIDAQVLERELSEEFEKFWEEHKAYAKRYNDATVKFGDTEMPLQEAISLFMTMKREHAFAGLAGAGFEIDGKKATENISDGFADEVNRQLAEDWKALPPEELLTLTKKKNAEMERAALKTVIEKKRQALYDQFTAEDRELIALMERAFEQCRDVKVKIDEIVQGYSNVTGGYYYPIKRTGLAENVDAYTGFEGDRVTNLSMNKETVKNAHKLLIEPAHIVFMRHLKATSLYHGLGVFTDNFNRLYNLDITGPVGTQKAAQSAASVVITLEPDAELDARIASSNSSRSKVLKQFLVEKFGGRSFTMSDGRTVVMDHTDAKEMSQRAGEKKTAQIANLEKLIEKAVPAGEKLNAVHDKFTDFYYYAVTVKYGNSQTDLLLNVGVAKNDGTNHLYSITDNKREAPTHYGVSGPVGNRIKSASPNSSISQTASTVNTDELKNYRGGPKTVRDALGQSNKFAGEMVKYFKELKADVEGISKKRSQEKAYNDAVAFIRSSYATYQLGANPKVWVTQLSSLIAATNIIDADCLTKGLSVSGKDVDEYCRLAWIRNNDSSAAQAQAVGTSQNAVQRASRNVLQKVRDAAMLPIGKVDRLVITRLFGACQVQVEKKGGAKVGTKENKIEAGKLLQRVILETQQNSLATERSAAMRSGDELLKGFTMFSADAMKVGARFVDAFGELSVLRTLYREAKKAGNSKDMARLEGEIKRARKQCVRATVSLVGVALFNAALAYGFKWLYRRDEDESLGTFIADTFGNMLGGIPFVRDLWSFFQDGFEMDHFLISTVNDVLGTVSASFELVSDAASGKEVTRQQVLANMRKVVYAAGQLSGVPTRNLYNFTTGVINRVSPEAGYAVESQFFKQSYASDLKKALDAGDDKMVGTIAGLMIDEKIGIEDAATRKTLQNLAGKGYSVLPRSVGDSVTVDGETVELTGAQQKKLREVYAIGQESVADMVKQKQFAEADEKVQAAAIKFIYDVYWDLALEDALGVDLAEKNVLFAEAIDIEKLAIIIATARAIEADKDKDGKAISGSKKRKVQTFVNSLRLSAAEKYMVMGYLGYSNVNGEGAVKAHISKLNLSKSEKAALLKYSGYGA